MFQWLINPINCSKSIVSIVLAVLLAGCTTTTKFPKPPKAEIQEEKEEQLKRAAERRAIFMDRYDRLQEVSMRLFRTNVEFCPVKKVALGIRYDGPTRTIMNVYDGFPSHDSGLLSGDELLSINGKALRPESNNRIHFPPIAGLLRRQSKNGTRDVTVGIRRNGIEELDITVRPVQICKVGLSLIEGDNTPNAFTDGQSIGITEGMMWFVENDEELALIVGHELAHITQWHVAKKLMNVMIAAGIGAAADAGYYKATGVRTTVGQQTGIKTGFLMFSQAFELEADYVGVYLANRAGYDMSNAVDMWRRMAAIHPTAIHARHGSTHPSTAARFVGIEHAQEEVRNKLLRGQELRPEKRGDTDSEWKGQQRDE